MSTPAISSIVKGEAGKEKGIAVFSAMILSLAKFYGGNWEPAQIRESALVCYDEWYYFTFAELSHFSKRAKTGFFGKMYGLFSPAILIDWLSTYAAETDSKRGSYFGNAKPQIEEPENPVDPEKIKKLVSELEHELFIQKVDEEIESQRKRSESINRYNEMIKKQAEFMAGSGGKTSEQVPDTSKVDF